MSFVVLDRKKKNLAKLFLRKGFTTFPTKRKADKFKRESITFLKDSIKTGKQRGFRKSAIRSEENQLMRLNNSKIIRR